MKIAKTFLIVLFSTFFLLLFYKSVYASDGLVDLYSTTNEEYRCFASSLRMQDQTFHILVGCKDLIYPAGENIYHYIIWANPKQGGNSIKLGAIGLGRLLVKTKTEFTSLLVTTEKDSRTKIPTGPVVMRGVVKPITILEKPLSPTPTSEEGAAETYDELEEITETRKLTFREKLSLAIRRAGIVIVLMIAALMGLVFVLTHPKS